MGFTMSDDDKTKKQVGNVVNLDDVRDEKAKLAKGKENNSSGSDAEGEKGGELNLGSIGVDVSELVKKSNKVYLQQIPLLCTLLPN